MVLKFKYLYHLLCHLQCKVVFKFGYLCTTMHYLVPSMYYRKWYSYLSMYIPTTRQYLLLSKWCSNLSTYSKFNLQPAVYFQHIGDMKYFTFTKITVLWVFHKELIFVDSILTRVWILPLYRCSRFSKFSRFTGKRCCFLQFLNSFINYGTLTKQTCLLFMASKF